MGTRRLWGRSVSRGRGVAVHTKIGVVAGHVSAQLAARAAMAGRILTRQDGRTCARAAANATQTAMAHAVNAAQMAVARARPAMRDAANAT
jgi:hypothetical protein